MEFNRLFSIFILSLLSVLCILSILCCKPQTIAPEAQESQPIESDSLTYTVKTFSYDSLTIPQFIQALLINHHTDFKNLNDEKFLRLCNTNDIDSFHKDNILSFYSIAIINELFSSLSAEDGSKGRILNIPYFWHWVRPNPRHDIAFTSNKTLLKATKPPKEFSKYNSFADIDRTPYLFLGDLFARKPNYFSAECGAFSSFGWCSEREMAFMALMNLFKIEGKVITSGNHSWSELIIPLIHTKDSVKNFKVTVDNTFNDIDWTIIHPTQLRTWRIKTATEKYAKWYNEKASSESELKRIKSHYVAKEATKRVESQLVAYLNKQLYYKYSFIDE